MQITVELPKDIAQCPDPAREALEALAIEGYRSGALTSFETRRLLDFETRYELDGFLKAHNVWEHAYNVEDFNRDCETLQSLENKRQPESERPGMIVVADASPLNYLVLIDQIDLLPVLYQKVLIPEAVFAELRRPRAPKSVGL